MVILGERDEALGQAWHVPNDQPQLTQRQFAELVYRETGQPVKASGVSKAMMAMAGLFIPGARETVEMMYEFEKPFVVDSSKFERTFGVQATPIEAAIKATVVWYRAHPQGKVRPIEIQDLRTLQESQWKSSRSACPGPTSTLILGDRSVLVDSGSAGDLVRIVAALRAHGADPKDLAAIVQTHGHADHAGCAASLRDLSDAPDRDDVNSFFEPMDYNALIYKFTHTASAPFAAANATSVLSWF